MRIILHVAGESDIGLNTVALRNHPDQFDARKKAVEDWRDELLAIDDPAELSDVIAMARSLEASGMPTPVPPPRPRDPPLVSLLRHIDQDDEIDLVLIGTHNDDGVPSWTIALTLFDLLSAHPRLFGPEVLVRHPIKAPSFDMDEIAEAVRQAMVEEDAADAPVVEVSWGSGSTEIGLAVVSGVIASGRRWLLRRSEHPFGEVSILPKLPYPAVVSWYLRYGYPGEVAPALDAAASGETDDAIRAAAEDQTSILRSVAAGSPDPDDLAVWVRTDVRRRNRTSGLAIRAWIIAEYRRRQADDGSPDGITIVERRFSRAGLGKMISIIRNPDDQFSSEEKRELGHVRRSRSGRWLDAQENLANAGRSSGHDFNAISPERIADLNVALDGEGDLPALNQCGPFHLPTGRAAYLWAVGHPRPQTTLDTVGAHVPPAEFLALVPRKQRWKASPQTWADLLILSSADESAVAYAEQQASAARMMGAGPDDRYVFATVIALIAKLTDGAGQEFDQLAEERARAAADRWLVERDVDAIVIVPTGPKPQVAGLVSAALAYGHRRAVPVFLQSINRKLSLTRFHRIVPYIATTAPALDLALSSMCRLAFDTSLALIRLCHPYPGRLPADDLDTVTEQLRQLDHAFYTSERRSGRTRLHLCAELSKVGDIVDQVRLAHIAAEICLIYDNQDDLGSFGKALVTLRNRSTINHGKVGFHVQLNAAFRGRRVPSAQWNLATLIERAAAELPEDPDPDRIAETYQQVEASLARFRDAFGSP